MYLKENDLVDIICPSSMAIRLEVKKVQDYLKKHKLRSRFLMQEELLLDKKVNHLFSNFAKEKRFKQLICALENTESKAVWAIRGGYGSLDLIPLLNKHPKIAQTKLFIGFSDVTNLANFLQQNWSWQVIYGPMLAQIALNKVSLNSQKQIFSLIFSKKTTLEYKLNNKNSNLEGLIVGGCLSVIASSFGTANQLDFSNKILFLEDIDESGEKIDRYFGQILQIMDYKKSYPSAILLGNFYENVTLKDKKLAIKYALDKFSKIIKNNYPNVAIFEEQTKCLGHSKNIAPLIIGKNAVITNGILRQKI